MNPKNTNTLILADNSILEEILKEQREIKNRLIEFKVVPEPEFLTSDQFMAKTSISRWKFDLLISQSVLPHKRIGRKIYIDRNQLNAFFDGKLLLKDHD